MTTDQWELAVEIEQERRRLQREREWADARQARREQERKAGDAIRAAFERKIEPLAKSENVAVEAWVELLDPYFDIEHEVPGRHYTGRKLRMDMLLHPKFEWRGGGRNPIGFEIKRPMANQAQMIGQAADYAQSRWASERYPDFVDVFVAVYAPMYHNRESCEHSEWVGIEQLLGRLGVIHLDIDQREGLTLRVSGNTAWTAKRGTCFVNWSAKRKYGSR